MPIKVNGKIGMLVWDYILWNELSFMDENGNKKSLYEGCSDTDAEAEFNKYATRYAIDGLEDLL